MSLVIRARFPIALLLVILASVVLVARGSVAVADDAINDPRIQGATIIRHANSLRLQVAADAAEVRVPRFFASLVSVRWCDADWKSEGASTSGSIQVTPEPDYWKIAWKQRGASSSRLLMEFDEPPLLASELQPVEPFGDGRFRLTASKATTRGEKVRYEPQPHKNTVGYWVGKNDTASWTIQVDTPGEFNVGILQGCGKGQGGSQATVEFAAAGEKTPLALDFTVEETGHFQDFRWRHLGTVKIDSVGVHTITIRPKQIAKAALMDVRELQLIRLPSQKR
jgi:hypothetical protein